MSGVGDAPFSPFQSICLFTFLGFAFTLTTIILMKNIITIYLLNTEVLDTVKYNTIRLTKQNI